jgi:hypothetical protein
MNSESTAKKLREDVVLIIVLSMYYGTNIGEKVNTQTDNNQPLTLKKKQKIVVSPHPGMILFF